MALAAKQASGLILLQLTHLARASFASRLLEFSR